MVFPDQSGKTYFREANDDSNASFTDNFRKNRLQYFVKQMVVLYFLL